MRLKGPPRLRKQKQGFPGAPRSMSGGMGAQCPPAPPAPMLTSPSMHGRQLGSRAAPLTVSTWPLRRMPPASEVTVFALHSLKVIPLPAVQGLLVTSMTGDLELVA